MNRSERRRTEKQTRTNKSALQKNSAAPVLPKASDEVQKLLGVGKKYHAGGDIGKAAETYGKILSIDPKQPSALYLLGVAFLQSGQFGKAIEFLQNSLSVFPHNAEANNNLGVAFNAAGKPAEAEKCYRQAISIKPDYAAAFKNLGALLASNDKLDAGLECYRKTVSLAPNLTEGHKAIGDILTKQQKYEAALDSYLQARALNPADAEILTSTGIVLQFLTRFHEAIKFHSQAVNLAPEEDRHWTAFSDCVSAMSFSSTDDDIESALLKLLEKNDLSPATLMFPIISALRHRPEFASLIDAHDAVHSDTASLSSDIKALTQSPLFPRLMVKVPIADLRIERVLTRLRRACLLNANRKDIMSNHDNFLAALAQQCFINEYAYAVSNEELSLLKKLKNEVAQSFEKNETVSSFQWLIIGCYEALKDVEWSKKIALSDLNDEVARAYHIQVTAPETEKALSTSIPILTEIEDETSQSVRAQYEENPYPRWIHTSNLSPKPIKEVLCSPPLSFDLGDYQPPKRLDILVAGCGTGQHAIQAASRFLNTTLTAVDLSLSSLSYAKRKTQEMGLDNIKYIQGDILELDKIGKQFDIIECGGVLHHMKDPLKGWEVLVRLLRDSGLMKIGLYSEKGRPDIIAGRNFISKGGYGSSASEMRQCRQDIIAAAEKGDQDLIQLCMRGDFYSLSPCRDLIFHVQEHRFTIPEISKALKKLGLEFIGFETPTPQPLIQFKQENPSSPKSVELERWHKFEERHPDTFRGMYQFWCRKAAR